MPSCSVFTELCSKNSKNFNFFNKFFWSLIQRQCCGVLMHIMIWLQNMMWLIISYILTCLTLSNSKNWPSYAQKVALGSYVNSQSQTEFFNLWGHVSLSILMLRPWYLSQKFPVNFVYQNLFIVAVKLQYSCCQKWKTSIFCHFLNST
jgi:hypothetical protein